MIKEHMIKFKNLRQFNEMIKHETIIRTGITSKKIPLQKSIEFGMTLK